MTLSTEQVKWLNDFAGMQALKLTFDKEVALKRAVLSDIRRQIDSEKENLRAAMTFDVKVDGKKIGAFLQDSGTQLDEVDFTEIGGMEVSKERADMLARASQTIVKLTSRMKATQIDRPQADGTYKRERLFSDDEIRDELYVPLVRERIIPETIVGDRYSETQQYIDQTNELYRQAIEEKKEKGELDEYDRVSSICALGSGLAKIGSALTDLPAFQGSDGDPVKEAELAKTIFECVPDGQEQRVSGCGHHHHRQHRQHSRDGGQTGHR